MPDSSDSPAPDPKAPEAAPGKAAAPAQPPAEPLSLVPRARSASALAKDNAAAAASAPAGGAASFGDFVNWMKVFTAAMETPAAAPPAQAAKPGAKLQRATLPKEQRKFQRPEREVGATEESVPVVPGLESPRENKSPNELSTSEAAVDADGEDEKPVATSRPVPIALTGGTSGGRRVKASSSFVRSYLGIALQAGVLIALIVSFFLGRASVRVAPTVVRDAAPAAPGVAVAEGNTVDVLSADAARMIDLAMAAEQDRKFPKAVDLLMKVQKANPQIRDIDYRLALLALEENDAAKALPLLNLSIAQGEQPAAAYKLRGTILNRKGGANKGMSDFENATKMDPFSAENFYFWGEALRKAGKPQAALEKLQQAMDRLREPELEAEYRLKIRLTQVELGQEQAFTTEMAERLAENPPPPDWLLTAAALELHRNNFAGAASYLEKAAGLMDKEILSIRLRDYYFYSYRFEKLVSRFFSVASNSAPAAKPEPTASPAAEATASPAPLIPTSPLLQGTPSTGMPAQPDSL